MSTADEVKNGITDRDRVAGRQLPTISDSHMREWLAGTHEYTVVLLRKTATFKRPGVDKTIWEHGRRTLALREQGVLSIVTPISDDGDWAGIAIFTGSVDQVNQIMDHDPGVQAGILTYEAHAARGLPGSNLSR
jgi:hypothetical protein